MKFLKEHDLIRSALVAAFFVLGIVLTIVGWKMTGKLEGLGIMMLGMISLLTSLFVYNKQYKDSKRK